MAMALDAFADQAADGGLGLRLVERHHHLAEAVDALGDAGDEALRHDRIGLLALREMHDLAHVAAADAARAAHDVDDVVVPARGDEADPRAALLHHGVGADGGAVRQQRHLGVEAIGIETKPSGGAVDGVDHALREIIGGGGRLGRGDGAAFVDHDTVGEGAADIDTDQIRAHPRFPLAAGLARPFCRYSRARPPSRQADP